MPFMVMKRALNPDGTPAGDGNWFFAIRTRFAAGSDAAAWIADPVNARQRIEYAQVEVPT